jgi:predicted dithiol-disulfide oxidoreductase (DUF899 family)
MTKDEIILIADASGISFYGMGKDRDKFLHYLEAFATLVAERECEACAKVCDRMAARCNDIRAAALESAAENIRARGNT